MVSIAGREQELTILEKALKSDRAEFIALYGRRRVGKTHLIRNYYGAQPNTIFFDVAGAKDALMKEQISNFMVRMGDVFYDGAKLNIEKNWNEVFRRLTEVIVRQPSDEKIVLFFDEFPWMATRNSRLLQQLDYYWNQYWSKDTRIKLVICGSSASWIIDNIVNNKKGLHNRITRQIQLKPLTLGQTNAFLKQRNISLNQKQILQLYLATGGIPYYLINVEPGMSAAQIIDELAFGPQGLLLNEFDNLFSSLFDRADQYIEVIRFIAKHRYGVSQEAIYTQIDKSMKGKKGVKILKGLEDASFIMSFKPHGHKKKGVYYRVIDEYTLFYIKWIEPVKDTLMRQGVDPGYWQIQQKSPSWQSWSGYAFEAICYKHIKEIKKALGLAPVDIPNTWRYVPSKASDKVGAQVDLLFDRQDDSITLCEIKYTDKPYVLDKHGAQQLMQRAKVFKSRTGTDKQIFWSLICANGIKPTMYSEELIGSIVKLDDLFVGI